MLTPPTPPSRLARLFSHRFLPHIVLGSGLLLSLWFASESRRLQEERIEEQFRSAARERLNSIRATLDTGLRVSTALTAYRQAGAEWDEPIISAMLALDLRPQFGLRSIQWAPRVTAAQRPAFEARMRRAGPRDFSFTQLSPDGRIVPAPEPRSEYFPVTVVTPLAGNESAIGFDHYADPLRRAAIDKARDSGEPAAALQLRPNPGTPHPDSVGLVFQPVYRPGRSPENAAERRASLTGLVVASVDLRQLFRRAMANHAPAGLNIALFDGAGPDAQLLHFHHSRLDAQPSTTVPPPAPGRPAGRHYAQVLALADLRWFVVATPHPAFFKTGGGFQPWIRFGAGAGLALFAFMFVRNLQQRTAALAQHEHRQRQLLDSLVAHLPYNIFVKDRALAYQYVNNNYARQLGLPPEAILGRTDADLYPPDLAAGYRADDQNVIASNRLLERDEPFRQRDGQPVTVRTIKVPMHDPRGAVTGLLGIFSDITARKQAEDALRESEARYRMLFAEAIDGIALADAETGIILDCNRALEQLVDRGRDELVGQPQAILHPPTEVKGDVSATFAQHRAEADGRVLAARVITRTGQTREVEIKSSSFLLNGRRVMQGIFSDVTAERAATEALRQLNAELDRRVRDRTAEIEAAHARLQLSEFSVAHASVPTFWIAEDARILRVNQAACDLMGYPEEALLRMRVYEFNPDLDPIRWEESWRRRQTQKRLRFESRIRRGDGRILLVEIESNWLQFDGQEYSFSFVRDITERKRTESALRLLSTGLVQAKGPSFFDEVVQQVARLIELDCVFVGSLRGSPASGRILTLGLALDGVLQPARIYPIPGTPCERALKGELDVIPRDASRLFPASTLLAELGAEGYAGVPLRGSRGQVLGVLAAASRRPIGEPAAVLETLQLFAVAVAAELERQRGEKRFTDLFEFAPDAIVMTDRQGIVRLVNRRAETMFGWSRHELIGQTIDVLMPLEPGEPPGALRQRFLGSATPFPFHELRRSLRARHRDGRTFPIDINVAPLETDDGMMAAAAVRDISEKKKLEEQFLRAQRMEGIGTLAGGIAHDLNNALVPILTGTALLTGQVPPAEHTLLEDMKRSAQRAANMVRQLLAYARGTEPNRQPIDLAPLFHEMEQIVRRTFPKNIELRVRHTAGSHRVLADATQLHQILLNLCVNARDAMPQGGILTLETTLSRVEAGQAAVQNVASGRYVILAVSDTGTGIEPAALEQIFNPFFTTKGPGQGTGLGLATALGIAKSHGGFIDVESTVGAGTRFSVFLPAAPATAEPPPAETSRSDAAAADATRIAGHGRRVLFVDDEPSICTLVHRLLKTAGFETVTAANGLEAMAQLETHGPAIVAVIVDMDMPALDGLGFVKRMRESHPALPAIATSGNLRAAQIAELHTLGVDTLLPKPFVRGDLLEVLQRVLGPNP